MKKFNNIRTISLLLWVIFVVIAVITMPNLDRLVQEKGQITMPDTFESEKASNILNDMKDDGVHTYKFVFVTTVDSGVTVAQKDELNSVLKYFKDHKEKYHITDTTFYNDSAQTEKQLVSSDGTTVINRISTKTGLGNPTEIANKFHEKLKGLSAKTYITGTDVITDNFKQMSQDGVQKTETIAIIFIILILILIFRSPVIPIVSLISVGVSYIISLNIITQLVDHFNFPFSTFTQVFLIVILFGIGTDYNILLYTRFREELANSGNALKAMKATFKVSGRTVIYSGVAVLFGLSALFFAQFKFYQATGAVAIGVFVLLVVLFTLNPFFMALLGSKLFWPVKKIQTHNDNKIWTFLASRSFARPIISLIVVAIIIIPSMLIYSGNLNFDNLHEIDKKYESKQAINIISDHFPAGLSAPTTFIIKNNKKLTTIESLQEIDRLTARIQEIDGVDKVYSVTRPEGKKIEALYLNHQLNSLSTNVDKLAAGSGTIKTSLTDSLKQSSTSQQQLLSILPTEIAQQMSQQAQVQAQGITKITKGLDTIESGLNSSNSYLTDTASNQKNTLNIPDSVLKSKNFQKSLDAYMNDDRHIATISIILKDNPYSAEAMLVAQNINHITHAFMNGSTLSSSNSYLGGKTMEYVDLEQMSKDDLLRSIIIILIGISIMLLFVTRSFAQTIVILVALVATCFASLGLTEWITTTFLGEEKLSWNVPFFTFIMLITLGVDYSIFLMMRYKEHESDRSDMIVEACKKMGGVILSAAIILGGTFAALIPSGMNSLIQVAIAVIIGLILLSFILMPLFIPSMFSLFNKSKKYR